MATNATYPPLNVLKPVAESIWIVDSGPHRVLGVPLPVRMTVIRLADGDVLLHSPTPFDAALQQDIGKLGRIRHLVAPNIAHWRWLGEWQRACSGTTTWAAPHLRSRSQVRRSQVRLDMDLGAAPPAPWAADLDQIIVPGGAASPRLHSSTRPRALSYWPTSCRTWKPRSSRRPCGPSQDWQA